MNSNIDSSCDSDGPGGPGGPPPPPGGPGMDGGGYECGGGGPGPGGDCGPDGCPLINKLTNGAKAFINVHSNHIEYYYKYFIPATKQYAYHIKGSDNSITCIRETSTSDISFNAHCKQIVSDCDCEWFGYVVQSFYPS